MKARVCGRCGKIVCGVCECKPERKQQTTANGYDRRWQRFRKRLIQKRAKAGTLFCAACGGAFGAESPHGDHIVPVEDQRDKLFFDEENIQFLHPRCHGLKTALDVQQGKTRR